jgi:pimeloyl-ACP methyl ester carboxylesterase
VADGAALSHSWAVPNYLTLSLSDDRDLDLITAGEGPRAVVLQHGTPADASIWREWIDPVVERGYRFVAVSRPGYATSARHHGRSVADAAADIGEVLDHLGISEFVTAGWSGGGPHALATAALLPGARAVASLAGVGPYGAPDLDFLAGMGPENEEEFGAVIEGEVALAAWMNTNTPPFKTVTAAEVADAFGGLVPQIDKDCLNNGFAETMAASDRRALAHGWTGWADDDFAFAKPWGFELETLAAKGIPVTIWQGDLDLMVPEAHGEWLHQHIAGSTIRRVPGHGHISLVVDYKDDILDDLTSVFG